MLKESKVRLLENFYGLDYVSFGKPVKEVKVCCPFFREEYISAKGALLSVVIEMYKLIGHKPAPLTEGFSFKDLVKNASKSAKVARENAKALVTSKAGVADIKQSLRESIQVTGKKKVNVNNMVNEHIRRKALALAVDSILLARVLKEAPDFKKLKTWEGKILEESYKTLRDNFVESAMVVIENITKE